MKWDDVGQVEEVVWWMRLVDLPRGSNRAILDKLYNGDPPETREEAEIAQNQVNRNFLHGTNRLIQSRSQWNNAFLGQATYYGVTLDSGTPFKRNSQRTGTGEFPTLGSQTCAFRWCRETHRTSPYHRARFGFRAWGYWW